MYLNQHGKPERESLLAAGHSREAQIAAMVGQSAGLKLI